MPAPIEEIGEARGLYWIVKKKSTKKHCSDGDTGSIPVPDANFGFPSGISRK